MSGNYLFLVCNPCAEVKAEDFGFKLAKRELLGSYEVFGPGLATKNLQTWLKKHSHCAGKGNPDHFVLAHAGERNYDQPKSNGLPTISQMNQ